MASIKVASLLRDYKKMIKTKGESLKFKDTKKYKDRLIQAQKATGEKGGC